MTRITFFSSGGDFSGEANGIYVIFVIIILHLKINKNKVMRSQKGCTCKTERRIWIFDFSVIF